MKLPSLLTGWCLLGLGCLALGPVFATAQPPAPRVLARWSGGELDEAHFRLFYDPEGKAVARGGDALKTLLCKAVFREIYQARALALGLDRDPELLARLESWRQTRLARLYQSRHFTFEVSEADARAVYQRDLATVYQTPANVGLDVLFVRCGSSSAERQSCKARFNELSRQLAAGESLPALISEERQRSGEANGHFEQVPLTRLDPALAEAVSRLEVGEASPPLETLLGWYLVRVTARAEAAPAPFEAVAAAARQRALEEALERWRAGEMARLSPSNPSAQPEAVLAAAAIAEGLALAPEFLADEAAQRSWLLADAAFLRHAEALPSDEQLTRKLADQPSRFRRYRLVLATLPAAGEPAKILSAADSVKQALASSAAPARRLAGLGSEVAGLDVAAVGPATLAELSRRSPRLAALVSGLETGGFKGPEPVSWRRLPEAGVVRRETATPSQPGLLFVAVEEVSLPPLAEVRDELLQDERNKLGESIGSFLARLQPVWKLELLVP